MANRRTNHRRPRVALGAVIVVALLATGGLLFRLLDLGPRHRVRELEQSLQQLRASLNADSIRQYHIQKVMAIIQMYNPEMPSSQRYEIANEIYNMTLKYTNLDVDLLCATITHETAGTWDPDIVSPAGAMGLMQIMPATGMFLASYEGLNWSSPEEVLFNPVYNVRLGARFLASQIDYYDVDGGLAAYNGGEKWAALWVKSGRDDRMLPRETREYLPAVLALYEEFANMRF
ncbi:MAG: transglycosylase SLT domain-containing protein [bacterium]|nr:transglycosylase SLT domain-containing protein [candidate division KSB1 bacterium]MDH7561252.1 transglycosylase SLT domain-containing protein [bacterium]